MKLPYVFTGDWSKTQWYNSDYRLYYLYYYYNYKYDFYWQFDYDILFNSSSNTYSEFLTQYNNNSNDFIVKSLRKVVKNGEWCWSQKIDWCYDDNIQLYGSFFPVVRISSKALEFLYSKMIEHASLFHTRKIIDSRWLNCEIFVPTELMNNNYICSSINQQTKIRLRPQYEKSDIPIIHDNLIYHPVRDNKQTDIKNLQIYNNFHGDGFYTINSWHNTKLFFIPHSNILCHYSSNKNNFKKIYVLVIKNKLALYINRGEKHYYLRIINNLCHIELDLEQNLYDFIINIDMSISIKIKNSYYLSAQRNNLILLKQNNLAWEHFYLADDLGS